MNLTNAGTEKLKLLTSAAGDIDVVCHYTDAASSTLVPSGAGTQGATITTATTTDILATPGASTTRALTFMSIRNVDASVLNDVTVVYDKNGTDFEVHKETLSPGECLEWSQELGFFKLAAGAIGFGELLMRVLDADATGQNVNTAQPWFPSQGGVALEAGVSYLFDGAMVLNRSAGATSHTTGMSFGGTATLTNINWIAHCREGDVQTLADSDMISAQSAANLQIKGTSTSTTEAIGVIVTGVVRINAGGTFIPQFTYSAAPGGAPSIKAGTYFNLRKLGVAFASKGTWT